MLTDVLPFVAVLACTLFTGASIYISLVEHPARLACSTDVAATQFGPSYRRATLMQVPLASLAGVCAATLGIRTGRVLWLLAALLILAVIPFTLVAILPTNKKLLAVDRGRSSAETRRLLETWGRLHAVRSVLSAAAAALFVWLAITGRPSP